MDWKDIAAVVGRTAPTLGLALGGPAGAAIGALVSTALGAGNTPDEVAAAIAKDPNAAFKLKELESEERVRLQEIALETAKAELADVQSARARDVELMKAGKQNIRADVMVIGVTVGLLACLFALAFYKDKIPPEAVGIISTIAGIFGACLKDAFTFEFGSSRSSQTKDATIANLTKP